MKAIKFFFLFTLFTSQSSFCQETNIAALRNGSWLIETPPSYAKLASRSHHKKFSPGSLLDETNAPWCSKHTKFPFTFVIELVEEYEISQLEFNNIVEKYAGIGTKKVRVSFSTSASINNYMEIGTFDLNENQIQTFPVSGKARRIKVTILENFGHSQYVELAEFKAFGKPSKQLAKPIDINGDWKSNWQETSFVQHGNTFTGSYQYENVSGTITNGRIHRNAIEFDYKEYDPSKGTLVGTALLYLNEEGNRLSGIWQNSKLKHDFGLWIMNKNDGNAIVYTTPVPEEENNEKEDYFEDKEVVLNQKIVLKNVLFIRGKSELLPEAFEELDLLVQTLKNDPSLYIELSGHTDNTGSKTLNKELSEQRVITVKKYLKAAGIQKKRISGQGYGGSQPIASNTSEATRRLNRRVEFKLFKK